MRPSPAFSAASTSREPTSVRQASAWTTEPCYAVVMSLQDDALRLGALDRQVVRAVVEGDRNALVTALVAYVDLRKRLKTGLLDKSAARVADEGAAEILRKVGSGDGLLSDKIICRLAAHSGEDASTHEFDEAELEELGSELFYSWYSHFEYVRALGELRPLVLHSATSEIVERLVWQVKQCYAFQQYDAAYALCRTLLEASIRDICMRRQLFPDLGENVILYEKYKWYQLRNRVSTGKLRDKLKDLYGRLSAVLHARQTVTAKIAHETFGETLEVIEWLYEENEL